MSYSLEISFKLLQTGTNLMNHLGNINKHRHSEAVVVPLN